jgi:hypothetical protein
VDEPAFLTAGRPAPDGRRSVAITRAGLAVPVVLLAAPPTGRHEILTGSFTWVASGLDARGHRRDRTWLDLNMTLTHAEELLQQRIYDLDSTR